jgi:hypothetical protein
MNIVPHPAAFLCGRLRRAVSTEAVGARVMRTFPENAAVMTSDGTILA